LGGTWGVTGAWFHLVQAVKEKHRIANDDTYNFDETGFMMGTELVVTGTKRHNPPKSIQPGDWEWTTAIQGANVFG
jgi:hypothetical protein